MREDTRSLWEQYDSEVEPWRRGRAFLICFGILSALSDLVPCAALILSGEIERLFIFAATRILFWIQFYFIWIGVHWVRWFQGAFTIGYGFVLFIWSLQNESGAAMMFGMFIMGTGVYLAFAPSVYFFAKRQQARRNWGESLLVAAAFGIVLLSLSAGAFGLFRYKIRVQQDALDFADTAFQRIFAEHDTYFLRDNVTSRLREPPFGRDHMTKFLQNATMFAGDVGHIQRTTAKEIAVHYGFPFSLFAQAEMQSQGVGARGPVVVRLQIAGTAGDWKIDKADWWYSDSLPRQQRVEHAH
jgi:hypothetical protein